VLERLKDAGLVASRQDPRDGRRHLYRLVEQAEDSEAADHGDEEDVDQDEDAGGGDDEEEAEPDEDSDLDPDDGDDESKQPKGGDEAKPAVPRFETLGHRQQDTVKILATHGPTRQAIIRKVFDVSTDHYIRSLDDEGVVDRQPVETETHGTGPNLVSLTDAACEQYDDISEWEEDLPETAYDPDDVDRQTVKAALEDAEDIRDVADKLDCSTERVLRLLGHYNLDDAILGSGSIVDLEEVEQVQDEVPDWTEVEG